MIAQSKPFIEKADFDYIGDIVKSGYLAQGRFVDELQNEFCKKLGLRYAAATSSGTAALHLALLSLGVTEDDEIIIPSYTCTALLNAVNYANAKAIIVDIDPETFNLTKSIINKNVTKRTKAIIVTHTFGFPADMDEILRLGIPVIEDCAQAIGARYKGKKIGVMGRVAVFSMYATKMLAAGEGGMICTNDKEISEVVMDLNNYNGRDFYRVRYNYKMSDLTAGLALNQLKKLNFYLERRRLIAEKYKKALCPLSLTFQRVLSETVPSYYRFVICSPKLEKVINYTRTKGIMCDKPVYKPLHHYIFSKNETSLSETDFVWNNAVSIPIYPSLKDDDVSKVIDVLKYAFKNMKVR